MMTSTSTTAKYHRTDFDEESVEAGTLSSGMGGSSSGGNGSGGACATNAAASVFDSPGGPPSSTSVFGGPRTAPRIYFRSQAGCWKSRTLCERLVAATLAVLILTIIVLAVILGNLRLRVIERPVLIQQNYTYIVTGNSSEPQRVCLTRTCVEAASRLMSHMDETADPCQDFYQYACGGFVKKTSIPVGLAQWSLFLQRESANQIVIRNIIESPVNDSEPRVYGLSKQFYRSCLNKSRFEELGSQPLLDLLHSLGGWDVIGTWTEKDNWNFNDSLSKIVKNTRSTSFFQFQVAPDPKNSSINILQLDQDGIRLDSRQYYLNKTVENDTRLKAYLDLMTDVGVLLGGERNSTRQKMLDVIKFEAELAKVMRPPEELRNQMENYHKKTIRELEELCPTINWFKFLNDQFSLVDIKLAETETLVVTVPLYIQQMCDLINAQLATKKGQTLIHNYMVWGVVYASINLLSEKFANVYDKFLKIYKGLRGRDDRWRECVKTTDVIFDTAVAAMFVKKEFNEGAKDSARTMIGRITAAFKGNLYNVQWMDNETRKQALVKVDAVTNMVGYPDYILNATALDDEYKEIFVNESFYFLTMLDINLARYKKTLLRLHKEPEKMRWEMKPTEINAYYTQNKNKIVFAAGILQRPFYDPNYPKAMNFGGIGVVVGHEITHGFDDKGREYDPSGNLRVWWNNITIQRFIKQSSCMVNQYSSYEMYGHKISGKLTLGENIADNGGLKASYLAYQKYIKEHGREPTLPALGLSLEQIFFLSYAQVWCAVTTKEFAELEIYVNPHSPEKFRVIGPLSNSPDFARAFNCRKNAPMNPSSKCKVW